jgi:hypothetical protein
MFIGQGRGREWWTMSVVTLAPGRRPERGKPPISLPFTASDFLPTFH